MWNFVILSDIHVHVDGKAADAFVALVKRVAAIGPRFVVLSGDMTSGNEKDGHSIDQVRTWWRGLATSLQPLREAHIPVLPIAGNHDFYTPPQQKGYDEAWHDLGPDAAALGLSGDMPYSYSLNVEQLHLSLVHVIDQDIGPKVAAWLRADLAGAASAGLRLCIGHVPLVSAMGHTNKDFTHRLGSLLCQGNVAAYICGHEHLVWDEALDIDGHKLRQITVGSASGTYGFPLRGDLVAAHCHGASCKLPYTGAPFTIDPATRLQRHHQAFLQVEVNGADYTATPLTVDATGQIVPYCDPPAPVA